MPFVSKQKGRMSHLLKEKSKVGVYQKERVRYESFDFASKRKRHPAEESRPGFQPPKDTHTITMPSGEKKRIIPKVISKDVNMRDKSQDK